MSVRVLVVDDHALLRMGLIALMRDSDISIVGEIGSGREALAAVDACRPDIVLLDVRLLDIDGLDVLGLLRTERPDVKILMLSTYDNPLCVAKAVAWGASGYLLKTISRNELVVAIRKVADGEDLWNPHELRRVTGALAVPRQGGDIESPLTHRETEVLIRLTEGRSNKEIAQELRISPETVKEHVQHVLRKLGVADRTQAAILAVRKNLA